MEEQEEKTPQNSPQQPKREQEQEKVEGAANIGKGFWISLWDDIGKIKDVYERVTFIIALLSAIGFAIWALFQWYNSKKVPDVLTESMNKITECVHDDTEITGHVYWNNEVKRGAKIKLKVFNTHTNKFEESRDNELKQKNDGSFKFHYCKATTSMVEFEVLIGNLEKPIPRQYKVDNIPEKISLN